MSERPLTSRLWYEFLRLLIRYVWSVAYSVRYSGRENIPPEGPVLVVPNHQGYLDPPLVGAGCRRRLNYLARKSLFRFGPFGWLIDSVNAIPIDVEGGTGVGGIKETLRRLRRGEMVLIFPEGSRTWDGEVGPFLPGFAALAIRGRAAVLPVAIEGAFEAWPRWRKLPRWGVIHVHYGVPISAERVMQYNEEELVAEARKRVCQCHAELRRRPVFAGRRGNRSPSRSVSSAQCGAS